RSRGTSVPLPGTGASHNPGPVDRVGRTGWPCPLPRGTTPGWLVAARSARWSSADWSWAARRGWRIEKGLMGRAAWPLVAVWLRRAVAVHRVVLSNYWSFLLRWSAAPLNMTTPGTVAVAAVPSRVAPFRDREVPSP